MALFLLTRDLRLDDNTSLLHLFQSIPAETSVFLVFVFQRDQIDPEYNPYHSVRSVKFMLESLESLHHTHRVHINYLYTSRQAPNLTDCLEEVYQTTPIQYLSYNFDYTPFAVKRDRQLRTWAQSHSITVISAGTHMLNDVHLWYRTKSSDKIYNVFTHFKNRVVDENIIQPPVPFPEVWLSRFNKLPETPSSISLLTIRVSQGILPTTSDRLDRDTETDRHSTKPSDGVEIIGGRSNGLVILSALSSQNNYEETRNITKFPTSRLSAYLKFGVVSVREAYQTVKTLFGQHHPLLTQFIWRDYYYYLLAHNQEILDRSFNNYKQSGLYKHKQSDSLPADNKGSSSWDTHFPWTLGLSDFNLFLERLSSTQRDHFLIGQDSAESIKLMTELASLPTNETHTAVNEVKLVQSSVSRVRALEHFRYWTLGQTGVPIVDAGMRQLYLTGFMHNRTRMCVAMYLTKHLHIHWKWGEWWFARQLVDYDPALNNGNWQWCASTGIDPLQYGKPRTFNFDTQVKKTDPDHVYLRYWLGQRVRSLVPDLPPGTTLVDVDQTKEQFISWYVTYIK